MIYWTIFFLLIIFAILLIQLLTKKEKINIPEVLPERNDLCFCGSGKKYKKCCINKVEKTLKKKYQTLPELVVVKIYTNEFDAEIAKSALLSCGIKAIISKDDCGRMEPYLQIATGVKLLVREKDAEEAIKILNNKH